MTIEGEKVWNRMNEQPEFLETPEPMREAMRPYLEALPVILNDLMDMPANLITVMQARARFLRYCNENGLTEAMAATVPAEIRSRFEGDYLEQTKEELKKHQKRAENWSNNEYVAEKLTEMGVSEIRIMLGSSVHLEGQARVLYLKGELTINKLLEVQPWFFGLTED